MAKRLMILVLVLVTFVSVFTVSVSAYTPDDFEGLMPIDESAYIQGTNIIQYNCYPNDYINGTDIFALDNGLCYVPYLGDDDTGDNFVTSGETPVIAYAQIPDTPNWDPQGGGWLLYFHVFSGTDWTSAGYEALEFVFYLNGVEYTFLDPDFDYQLWFDSLAEGDLVEITIRWREIDGTADDLVFDISSYGNVEFGYSPEEVNTVPFLWLVNSYKNNSSTGGGNSLPPSVLHTATYQAYVRLNSGIETTIPITPNLSYDGVSFQTAWSEIISEVGYSDGEDAIDYVDIILTWELKDTFSYLATPVYRYGEGMVTSATLYSTDGRSFIAEADASSNNAPFVIGAVFTGNPMIERMVIRVARPEDLLTHFTLYTKSMAYNTGYDVGYNEGYTEGAEEGWYLGNDHGYAIGVQDGYAEGLTDANQYTFRSLFTSVIDAPVNAFRSLFSFEILGIDMQVAIGSLLSILVILIVIKKLVL